MVTLTIYYPSSVDVGAAVAADASLPLLGDLPPAWDRTAND